MSHPYLINEVPMRTGAMSVIPYSAGAEAAMMFVSDFGDKINMSLHEGNVLYVPRETMPWAAPENDYRIKHPTIAIDCNFEPRGPEQGPLVAKSLDLLRAGTNHVFRAPTGWGKTIAGSAIACALGQPTVIIVPKEDLMDQWYDALVNVLGVDPMLIGKVQQNGCVYKGKRIVLAMLQSVIIEDRYPPDFYKFPGLIIFDEAHLIAADVFSRACQIFPAFYRLGFSATDKRRDGKSKILVAHIGPTAVIGTLVPMKPKVLVKHTGWKIPNYPGTTRKIQFQPGRMMSVYKAMMDDPARNAEAAEFVYQAYKAGRSILVLADMIDHLKTLFHVLVAKGISGEEIGYYIGGMSKLQIGVTKKARIVLGTYKMCATGTNVPHWDTLLMLTPRANVEQPVGRVLRTMSGKLQPVILDLVDYDGIFNGFYLARLKVYYKLGAEIVKV